MLLFFFFDLQVQSYTVASSVQWHLVSSINRRSKQVQIYNSDRKKDLPAGRLLIGEGVGLKWGLEVIVPRV